MAKKEEKSAKWQVWANLQPTANLINLSLSFAINMIVFLTFFDHKLELFCGVFVNFECFWQFGVCLVLVVCMFLGILRNF